MKITMTKTLDVGTYGLMIADHDYDHLPENVCSQLIAQGSAVAANDEPAPASKKAAGRSQNISTSNTED